MIVIDSWRHFYIIKHNFHYLCDMKKRPVHKPSFDIIFSNAIASAKIEGIRFDKKTETHIKKEVVKKIEANSR